MYWFEYDMVARLIQVTGHIFPEGYPCSRYIEIEYFAILLISLRIGSGSIPAKSFFSSRNLETLCLARRRRHEHLLSANKGVDGRGFADPTRPRTAFLARCSASGTCFELSG